MSTRSKHPVGFATIGAFSIVFELIPLPGMSDSCRHLFSNVQLGVHVNTRTPSSGDTEASPHAALSPAFPRLYYGKEKQWSSLLPPTDGDPGHKG